MRCEQAVHFEQRAFPLGKECFTIRPDGELEVEVKRIGLLRKFTIPLWQINPRSDRLRVSAHGLLIGTLVFGIGALASILGMVRTSNENTWGVLIMPVVFCTIFFVVCLWKYRAQAYNGIVFYTAGGGNVFIQNSRKRIKAIEDFCAALSKSAAEAISTREETFSTSLAGEILALQKLQERGILAPEEFQRAKERLIGSQDKRQIGFAPQTA